MPTALVNGRIYTVDEARPWAQAVLIEDGTLAVVGTDDEVRAAAAPGTDVVDLGGRMVMPGIHDAHTHLLFSGLKFRFEARLTAGGGPQQVVRELSDAACRCSDLVAEGEQAWIVGGEVFPHGFAEGELDRSFLDAAFPDQPVFLHDWSAHHALVNSKALELAGLDDASVDPPGGRLVRRVGTGELTGELVEQATWPVVAAMTAYRPAIDLDAVRWATSVCHRYGITSVQEASASPRELAALRELDRRGELALHVAAHLVWREEGFGLADTATLDRTIEHRQEFATAHVDPQFVKIWLDGAPLPPHMTQADLDDEGRVDGSDILVEHDQLASVVGAFDAAGIAVKIHCAGQGAVRAGLDAFAEVRARRTGEPGPRHEIAHCTFVPDDDHRRFAELGVVAEMSPAVWHIEEYGVQDGYRFRSMLDAGATMTVGSDWIVATDPNLFPALQGMLERGDESVTVEEMLETITLGGARVVGRDAERGSIEVGKSADLVVLDRNLLEIDSGQVGGTVVLQTWFEGRRVFSVDEEE